MSFAEEYGEGEIYWPTEMFTVLGLTDGFKGTMDDDGPLTTIGQGYSELHRRRWEKEKDSGQLFIKGLNSQFNVEWGYEDYEFVYGAIYKKYKKIK